MSLSRWVAFKLLGSIALLLSLSLAAAIALHVYVWPAETPSLAVSGSVPGQAPVEVREPASLNPQATIFEDHGTIPANLIYQKTAIDQALRAREVVFLVKNLPTGRRIPERTIDFDLFPDTHLRLHLQRSADLGVNEDILVGQVEGDQLSRVRLQVSGDRLDGRIETGSSEYRILYVGDGRHWIVEARLR